MFVAAARGVAEQISPEELESGLLYPPQSNIFETELKAAERFMDVIFARGLARVERPRDV